MTDDSVPIRIEGVSLGLGERTGALLVYQTRDARGKTVYAWDAAGRRTRVTVAAGKVAELDWFEPAPP